MENSIHIGGASGYWGESAMATGKEGISSFFDKRKPSWAPK